MGRRRYYLDCVVVISVELAYPEGGKDDSLHFFPVSSSQHITENSSQRIPIVCRDIFTTHP